MATACVYLPSDVYMVCLNHSLSTEREEVMGLLIGEIDEKRISHISAVIMLRRSDKRKDRVEISPEQLSDASTQAERLAQALRRPMRVLGWYHSHPHITVWPSHVDVQTQAMYQMMDEGFVGLIFSVFSEESSTKHGRIQVTCFQSINQSPEGEPPQYMRLEIPLHVIPSSHVTSPCLDALVQLPRILCQEEQDAYSLTCQIPELDLLTRLHNNAVYTKSLCHIAEVVSGPLLQTLESRLRQNAERAKHLEKEKERVLEKLKELYEEKSEWKTTREIILKAKQVKQVD
ncbi:lys-63-specific deubiquitinase BRCC36-like [Centruroides sculpturatus]|uniref:lys-63-specific deubiquitinase BRCC36-like n=2 Tax=Centruroides TaxID=6875 RepID=UPI000C6DBD88|nr:lys-63-specific deubiquitinase BRCC36-like [Centruroides sculpturatus]